MSYVTFQNKGIIDIRAIKTFGLSAKEGTNPIGFFGTGLKYSLAILMREGIGVTLLAGDRRYDFHKKPAEMRGKSFEVIKMNDEELPFTTELGKNWELWQAFRELYCNCIDEGGTIDYTSEMPGQYGELTTFAVCGDKFMQIFNEKHKYILDKRMLTEIHSGNLEIFQGKNDAVFYRGIKVLGLEIPSKYTYNFTEQITLTEDRTVKDSHNVWLRLSKLAAGCTDRGYLKDILLADETWMEGNLHYDHLMYQQSCMSSVFVETLRKLFESNNDKLNKSARRLWMHINKTKEPKHLEDYTLTAVQEKQLKRANGILNKVFPDFLEYKLRTVKSLGQETMAYADTDDKTMIVSYKCFEQGTKFLVSTLMEEYLHLKTGHPDLTRAFQTAIFDAFCTLIEEHVIEEAM